MQPLFHQILQMEVQMPAFSKTTDYTRQQFLAMSMDVLPASKGLSQLRDQFSKPLLALMGIVAVGAADCLFQSGESADRARVRPSEGKSPVRLALGATRRRLIANCWWKAWCSPPPAAPRGSGWQSSWIKHCSASCLADISVLSVSTSPDDKVLGFALLVSARHGPAVRPHAGTPGHASASGLHTERGGRGVVGGTSVVLRKGLVVAQVALSLLLLIGAGLFVHSLKNLKELDPGFRTTNLVSFAVDPTLSGRPQEWSLDYYRRLSERLQALPGVASSTLAVMAVLDR